jgi:hypothetical protein
MKDRARAFLVRHVELAIIAAAEGAQAALAINKLLLDQDGAYQL